MKKSPPWIGKKNDEMGHGLVDATKAVTVAHRFGLAAPNSSPRLDYYVTTGAAAQYDNWFVIGNNTNATIMFSLRNAQINSTYSYFWHLEASPINGWAPSFSYLGNDTGVIINITRPSVETILTVSCEIFDGSTYICTASLPLTIRLNNP